MPLTGLRVIDLSRIISGPFCAQLLGDMGAEVIKIEAPDRGDPVRAQGVIVEGMSWYYAYYNRNKKSLTLNLRSAEGKAILSDLIRISDVVVENFRPGVMEELGFGYSHLKQLKPDIIYCSITGFGKSGPYKDRPAVDFIAQAMSGFMSVNGNEGGNRCGPAFPLAIWSRGSMPLSASWGLWLTAENRSRPRGALEPRGWIGQHAQFHGLQLSRFEKAACAHRQ